MLQDQHDREGGLSCRLAVASMLPPAPRPRNRRSPRPSIEKIMRLIKHLALMLLLIPLWPHAGHASGQPAGAAGTNQRFEHSQDMGQNRRPIAIALPTSISSSQSLSNSDVQPDQSLTRDISAKWTEVLARIDSEEETLAACRATVDACSRAARRLLGIVELGRQRVGRARLGKINRAVNLAIRAASDRSLYGVDDLWSTPLATLEKGAGDCEDYAILKYLALREAGISPEDLRLLVVSHPRRRTLHAVLAVHLENDWLLLDNLTMVLVNSVEAKQYQPLLALDHQGIRTVFAGAPALGFPGTTAGP
jgi:predicted transglutaminase-like cysteine proteinase